ncbi:MAG: hypothetical protein ACK4RV_06840 [Caulobacter sp.]
MDHYGRLVDVLTDLWEELERADLIEDAAPVRKALEKAMVACVAAERIRRARSQAEAARRALAEGLKSRNVVRAARPATDTAPKEKGPAIARRA